MQRRRRKARRTRPKRYPDQTPASVRDALPLAEPWMATRADVPSEIDASLRERARQIITELEATSARNEVTTLEAWMAHYIAELMHRADDAAAALGERAAAARDCAEVVLQLWELRVAREQATLGYSLCRDSGREERGDDSHLVAALDNPTSVRTWSAWDRLGALYSLAGAEQEATRALYLATLRREDHNANADSTRESAREGDGSGDDQDPASTGHRRHGRSGQEEGQREGLPNPKEIRSALTRAITAAAKIFPQVGAIDVSDDEGIRLAVSSALSRSFVLRAELLKAPPKGAASGPRSQRPHRMRPTRSTPSKKRAPRK